MKHARPIYAYHSVLCPAHVTTLSQAAVQGWPSLETHIVIGLRSLRLDGTGELLNQAATLFYRFLEGDVPVEQQQATTRRLSFSPTPLNHFMVCSSAAILRSPCATLCMLAVHLQVAVAAGETAPQGYTARSGAYP